MTDPQPMAITVDGALKPLADFTEAEKWWCECDSEPRPHVHCFGHRHLVDLVTGMGIDASPQQPQPNRRTT